jgi:hypothetical protein
MPRLHWCVDTQAIGKFILLVAYDTTGITDAELKRFARDAIHAGCVYACSWGPEASRMHDVFDEVRDEEERFIMTTEEDGSLADALLGAVMFAVPDEPDLAEAVIVLVGRNDWADEIRLRLTDPDRLWA